MLRRTVRGVAEVAGRGLFSGAAGAVRIGAGEDGIRFRRAGGEEVAARIENLAPLPAGVPARCTNLVGARGVRGAGAAPFMTVEHILSALAGLGVTDATVELEGPEVPIGDGSAAAFAGALLGAGIVDLGGEVEPLRLEREVVVERAGARIVARPRRGAGCLYRYELDYGAGGPIPAQAAEWNSGAPDAAAEYARAVAPARTFCLAAEAEQMRAAGLFKGLSPRDMLVFGEAGPIDNALRFEDEPARHKLLDLIGDLALLGRPLGAAEVVATRSGHALTHELVRAILATC